jgi:hypothetical protein
MAAARAFGMALAIQGRLAVSITIPAIIKIYVEHGT